MALELVAGRPAAVTGAVVRRYAGYREHTGEPLHRRERAGLMVPLILAFGPEIEVAPAGARRRRLGAFVGGPSTTYADTWHGGEQHGVQVDLDLLGARRVLGGISMAELADRVVPLEDVFGADGRRLLEALAGAPSWPLRFALVDAFLARRLADAPLPPPDLVRAWRRLAETGGRLGIGALAVELGCSRRHLTARFREHVGVPPKVAGRLLRLEGALALLDAGVPLAETALRAGFYDQPHLDRDVRALAGETPGAYAARRSQTSKTPAGAAA